MVPLHRHQAGAGYARYYFNVAIEGGWHRHQIDLLLLKRLGEGNARIVRMLYFRPESAATDVKPGIQFDK